MNSARVKVAIYWFHKLEIAKRQQDAYERILYNKTKEFTLSEIIEYQNYTDEYLHGIKGMKKNINENSKS